MVKGRAQKPYWINSLQKHFLPYILPCIQKLKCDMPADRSIHLRRSERQTANGIGDVLLYPSEEEEEGNEVRSGGTSMQHATLVRAHFEASSRQERQKV